MEPKTLLVVPKTKYCNANCKFCITKDTQSSDGFEPIQEKKLDIKKLESVVKFARQIGVVDANITGGTEPTLAKTDALESITSLLSEYFGRVTMYTNGERLLYSNINGTIIGLLAKAGLTNIVISRAHYDSNKNKEAMRLPKYNLEAVVEDLVKNNIDIKLSCLLSKEYISTEEDIINYISKANSIGIKKIIFRELLHADENNKYGKWARDNYVPVKKVAELMQEKGVPSFAGVWGQKIWDYNGVAVTIWPDGTRKDTVNNGDLIFMPDNNLYSNWVSLASKIM